MTASMLKIRGGKETYTKPDGSTGSAGKGPLVGEEFAFTLSTTHDQTLFTYPPPPTHSKMTTGFSHSNSDMSLATKPTPECALTIRSAPTGETACIIDTPPQEPKQLESRPMTLTYVSLFSGIEAFSVAASRIRDVNWEPVFFSEIDPFPCAALSHHFPNTPNLGDVCKIRVVENPETHQKEITNGGTTVPFPGMGIDILAGGSPCQDVSVAGLRKGMQEGSGTRSSLAHEYARLVEELRPRIILWENVPGCLSSNSGADFHAFLCSLVKRGYSCAYRVLDAQYVRVDGFPRAVPQRRKRVWLVGCLGGDGSVPAQILFERPSLLRDSAPRRETGKGFACPPGYVAEGDDSLVGYASIGINEILGGGAVSPTLFAGMSHTCGSHGEFTRTGIVTLDKEAYNAGVNQTGGLGIQEEDRSPNLRATGCAPAIALAVENNTLKMGDATRTLTRDHESRVTDTGTSIVQSVAVRTANTHAIGVDAYNKTTTGDVSKTLGSAATDTDHTPAVMTSHIVRRLTPVECERIQGFPDGWTNIPWRTWQKAARKGVSYESLLAERGMQLREPTTEDCPDSPRYKALGNSWATNCAEWVLRRIVAAMRLDLI